MSQDLNAVRTNSIAGAPLDGHPPVVMLLPGLGEPVAAYSALAEDLASHGYAVVGMNPTGQPSWSSRTATSWPRPPSVVSIRRS